MHVSFEQVFDVQTKQDEVFEVVARPVIDKLVPVSLCFTEVTSVFSALKLLAGCDQWHPMCKNVVSDLLADSTLAQINQYLIVYMHLYLSASFSALLCPFYFQYAFSTRKPLFGATPVTLTQITLQTTKICHIQNEAFFLFCGCKL